MWCIMVPVLFDLEQGLAGRDVLVPLHTSNSCGVLGAMHADMVTRCMGFPLTHIGVAGSAALLGCVLEDARLATFASPESVRELQRWDKTVTMNWMSR